MSELAEPQEATLTYSVEDNTLFCRGAWVISQVEVLISRIKSASQQLADSVVIDGGQISAMDSAGALQLCTLTREFGRSGQKFTVAGFSKKHASLLDLVHSEGCQLRPFSIFEKKRPALYVVGKWFIEKMLECFSFLAFTGQVAVTWLDLVKNPVQIKWKTVFSEVELGGYDSLPIVALLSFLIGIVITYQIAGQLALYGANIYIVDISGMIILREFGPLITAIIAAARTSTAYAAQIGTMKVNEEVDALRTMGISPIRRLVMPKFIGLLIAMPLLAVWADAFGVFGSMLMSRSMLNMSFITYIDRFQHVILVRHYFIGLIKMPVFAGIIAIVGCYQGFQTSSTSAGVGKRTTQSAVQSIFLIIIADAIFSIIFSMRGM